MKKFLLLIVLGLVGVFLTACSENVDLEPQTTIDNTTTVALNDTAEKIISADYSTEFNSINGCAVFYSPKTETYTVYNDEMCNTRYSPYSTFKIIGVLEGLNCGVLTSEQTKMKYSGDTYPFESWNKDLTLDEAFKASCVWYFRQVIDGIGEQNIQTALNKLGYGNCDISQWKGSGANEQEDLNGFWLGSSLKISPVEQVRVLSDIFEGKTDYTPEQLAVLKNVMKSDTDGVYGKTGTGKEPSAWYTGFYENNGEKVYFAVYMQDSSTENLAGAAAKETAYKIIDTYYR